MNNLKFKDLVRVESQDRKPIVLLDPNGRKIFEGKDEKLALSIKKCFSSFGFKTEIAYTFELK